MVAIHSNSDSSGEIWEIALVLLAAANVTHLVKFINKPISPPPPPKPGRVCDGDALPAARVSRVKAGATGGYFNRLPPDTPFSHPKSGGLVICPIKKRSKMEIFIFFFLSKNISVNGKKSGLGGGRLTLSFGAAFRVRFYSPFIAATPAATVSVLPVPF